MHPKRKFWTTFCDRSHKMPESWTNLASGTQMTHKQNKLSLIEDTTDSHMFMDFKNHVQPIFAPQDLNRKQFDHKNKCVHPYLEMTRK